MRLCAEPIQGLVAVNNRRAQICERTMQRIASRQGKTSLFPLVGGAMKIALSNHVDSTGH